MIRIWGRINSLNVQKVLWALAELDLRYERIDAGMKFGVVDTAAYRAMNPNGLVPTMDDDGFVLWESNVIIRYLASRHAVGTLFPGDDRERFSAERWMDWQQTRLNPRIGMVFTNLIRLTPDKRDMAAVTKNAMVAENALAILDAQLATRTHVNGESFTMADIPVATSASRWSKLPIEKASRPNIARWLAQLRERPGFKAHIDQSLS